MPDAPPRLLRTLAAIPCYNEELAISGLVLRARQHVDSVLVVDDGSTDRTSDQARLAGATIVRHAKNEGKGAAVISAFQYAIANGYEALVLLDGDGQHDPDDLLRMLAPILRAEAPVDVVWGVRDGDGTDMPAYRRAGKRVLDVASAATTGTRMTDSQCGYRAFGPTAIRGLGTRLRSQGFGVESEMIGLAKELGFRSEEVNVPVRYKGIDGSTLHPVSHAYRVLDRLLVLLTMRRPLLTVGLPGLLLVVAGGFFVLRMMQVYDAARIFLVSYALAGATLVLLGGVMIATALMLNVILLMRRELV